MGTEDGKKEDLEIIEVEILEKDGVVVAVEEVDIEVEEGHEKKEVAIQIDRAHYEVKKKEMTGAELRDLPAPPVGPERDLFEVVPGEPDLKIETTTVVKIKNGLRFFTAPAHINPGNES